MNLPSIILAMIIVLSVAAAGKFMWKQRGKGGCCGNCGTCRKNKISCSKK